MERGTLRRLGCGALVLGCLALEPPAVAGADPQREPAEAIFESLTAHRAAAGLAPVRRSAALDRVAARRAESIARSPADRRLPPGRPLDEELERDPALADRKVVEHVDLQQLPDEGAVADVELWRPGGPSGELALGPRLEAVGLALRSAKDGTQVLVALFMERRRSNLDLAALERRTIAAINRIRGDLGLGKLAPHDALREVAREHSEDMARRGFFAHASPEGLTHTDRVREYEIDYRMVAENLGRSLRMDDPVAGVVDGWMDSPGHHVHIVNPDYTRTAVGVAVGSDGMLYFTQLFLQPRRRR